MAAIIATILAPTGVWWFTRKWTAYVAVRDGLVQQKMAEQEDWERAQK